MYRYFLRIIIPIFILSICFTIITSCDSKSNNGKLQIQFEHRVNGQALVKDQMIYTNAIGNLYKISGLKYFISDVKLHRHGGSTVTISSAKPARYVDIDIPGTLIWQVNDEIPAIAYDSISFTFGMNEQLNKSHYFVNPPESNMAWPDLLGGGYHFMMMDGFYNNLQGVQSPFNFHLGMGQIYEGGMEAKYITGFVQNYFHIKLPASSFVIINNQTKNMKFIMNIDSWFTSPVNWDFNQWSIMIMQNQAAMQTIKSNGHDVFSFETE